MEWMEVTIDEGQKEGLWNGWKGSMMKDRRKVQEWMEGSMKDRRFMEWMEGIDEGQKEGIRNGWKDR